MRTEQTKKQPKKFCHQSGKHEAYCNRRQIICNCISTNQMIYTRHTPTFFSAFRPQNEHIEWLRFIRRSFWYDNKCTCVAYVCVAVVSLKYSVRSSLKCNMCISIYACAKCLPIFIGTVSCYMVAAAAVHLSQTINNLAKILRLAIFMHAICILVGETKPKRLYPTSMNRCWIESSSTTNGKKKSVWNDKIATAI